MSLFPINAPGGFVPLTAIGYGGEGAPSILVTPATPLPVVDPAATSSSAIVPSDTTVIEPTRSLVVLSGGDVTLRLAGDDHDSSGRACLR